VPDLTTKAAYKAALGLGSGTGSDAEIDAAIAAASDLIYAEYQREFTPVAAATREVVADGRWIDLTPFDLRTVTSITLDPSGASRVLTASEYQRHPVPSPDGVATALELLIDPPAVTGYLIVSIDAAWGFADVPKPVERACIDTVRSMLQRDPGNWMQATAADGQGMAATPQGTYSIPASARRWLDPYRRYGVIG
jgi:hypothetical protein